MSAAAAEGLLARLLARACRMDVVSPKPGNVSLCAAGHGMTAADFLRSAAVAAPALATRGARVGPRIEAAVAATHAAVGTNTNLGIVLLLAPLAYATELSRGTLHERTADVLAELDIDDAACCFRAIRLARPAGLGDVAQEDVAHAPQSDLRAIMRLAAARDSIAAQYANGFTDVFALGLPTLYAARRRWHSLAWACVACHLRFMVEMPDTHVARKHGTVRAERLQEQAREVESALKACENPRRLTDLLQAFDRELKSGGVNPGTSADLTVASVAALLLTENAL